MNLTYHEYAAVAKDCDIALWRPLPFAWKVPRSWIAWGRYIDRYTGNCGFSHVTGVLWWGNIDRLMSCGYEEGKGGFAEPLDAVIERHHGLIEIHRVREEYWAASGASRDCVAKGLGQRLGGRYRWRSIRLIASPLLPVIGLFQTHSEHEGLVNKAAASRREGICSEHVARSFEDCGIRLCKKSPALVTPNDIWNSSATEYVGTLVRDDT